MFCFMILYLHAYSIDFAVNQDDTTAVLDSIQARSYNSLIQGTKPTQLVPVT